jgi:hypothetical protein
MRARDALRILRAGSSWYDDLEIPGDVDNGLEIADDDDDDCLDDMDDDFSVGDGDEDTEDDDAVSLDDVYTPDAVVDDYDDAEGDWDSDEAGGRSLGELADQLYRRFGYTTPREAMIRRHLVMHPEMEFRDYCPLCGNQHAHPDNEAYCEVRPYCEPGMEYR